MTLKENNLLNYSPMGYIDLTSNYGEVDIISMTLSPGGELSLQLKNLVPYHVHLNHFLSDHSEFSSLREELHLNYTRFVYKDNFKKIECLPVEMKILYEDVSMYLSHDKRS